MSSSKHYGLTPQEVEASRQQYGSNRLTPPAETPLWRKFLEKFEDRIIQILLLAMLLSFGVSCYHYWGQGEPATVFLEPLGVLVAVLLATGVAFYFELKSQRAFEALSRVSDEVTYKVYRSGQLVQVPKVELVVGDHVLLESGEEVPADGQLLEALALQVNESTLTGEPLVGKTIRPEDFDPEATYPSDWLYRGTTLLEGHGLLRVEQVGDHTEYGKIYQGAQIEDDVTTPLTGQLHRLAKLIERISYTLAGLVLLGSVLLYLLKHGGEPMDWAHALSYFLSKVMLAVTVIIVAVPEGLPMSVSLSLAYSMRSLMQSNNLVRRLHACETMGAATVICTDKTGTLTQNKMQVTDIVLTPEADELLPLAIALNATAHLDEAGAVLGNPTEGALLLWLQAQGHDYRQLREDYTIVEQLPFSTERKYMASVIALPRGGRLLLAKGAPEVILSHCSLSGEERAGYDAQLLSYQHQAKRTLALAVLPLDEGETNVLAEKRLPLLPLRLLALVGIADPIRPDVPAAIASCREAGIAVKIITGDTSGTAIEIGRQIGLWDETCQVGRELLTGAEFASLSDEELRGRVGKLRIMSRARPMDKERLVRLLQAEGEVVAVTGDGTNDAPALNRAHVGLSMGDGTAVAKEASDITILDNSFSSITKSVMWGRSLYLNIQRFILFQMTINVAACLIVLLGAFLGAESPLTVVQMLWVNLIMDTFAALALASLPASPQLMSEPPRSRTAGIITRAMAGRILGVGLAFVALLFGFIQYFQRVDLQHLRDLAFGDYLRSFLHWTGAEGAFSAYELTVFFGLFVFLQFWNMFHAKAFRSGRSALSYLGQCRNFLLIAGVIVLGQVLITTFGGDLFRVVPLDGETWLGLVLGTSLVLWLGEGLRLFRHLLRPTQG